MPKKIDVLISLMDSENNFSIKSSTTGGQLHEQVANSIGLQEVHFFGLEYLSSKGTTKWLKLQKKVLSHDVEKKNPLQFKFRVRFYPADVEKEMTLNNTRKLFLLQLEEDILSKRICCPPETADLLASYAHKAKCGEDEAMMEYLKTAQDVETYGISYFDIKDKQGTEMYLGVGMQGLKVYMKGNKLTPTKKLLWRDISNCSYNSKKIFIKLMDKNSPPLIYYSSQVCVNKLFLEQCLGYHCLWQKMSDQQEARRESPPK